MSDFYRNRRVLVIGGLGFIGSNLAHRLVEGGAEVTISDSLLSGHGANRFNIAAIRDRVRLEISDILDLAQLRALVRDQDLIFSLAAQVSHVGSMREPLLDLDINCRGQLSLLECCREHNRGIKIVFTSTRQVYGRPRYLPIDERHPIAPVDANGVSKRAAEMYFLLYQEVYGIQSVILRLTNTYGPRLGLRGNCGGFMSVFIREALRNGRIDIFGTGEQQRDFNFVDDVVDALLLAGADARLNGQTFNLGHARHHSILQLVEILRKHADLDCRCVPFPENYAAIDLGDYYGDFSKFHGATGWSPRFDLETGIKATFDFFQEHRTHYLEAGHDPNVRLS